MPYTNTSKKWEKKKMYITIHKIQSVIGVITVEIKCSHLLTLYRLKIMTTMIKTGDNKNMM